jgi:hypothetical protein
MRERDEKIYAGLLLGSALLSLLAAAHHPEAAAHDLPTVLPMLVAQQGLIVGVHAMLIFLAAIQLLGLYGVARLLGLARPLSAAGLIFFAAGTAAMVAAAAVNGFAVPAFAADYRNIAPADMRGAAMLLRLCWQLNQAFASIGAVAWGIGLLFWSIALARRHGLVRLVGMAGAVASLAIAGGVGFGFIRLHVGGFIAVTALLAAWSIAIALLMLSGRLMTAQADTGDAPA